MTFTGSRSKDGRSTQVVPLPTFASVVSLPILQRIGDLGTDSTHLVMCLRMCSDPNSPRLEGADLSRKELPLATESLMMSL
jgi:hypothetical protein